MANYVLIHGAWHTGDLLKQVADPIRAQGHQAHTPTLAGNRPGDKKKVGLEEAVQSVVDYFNQHRINDAVVMGHSYGGMIIAHLADRMPDRIRRLVFWNAFVPLNGEALNDMVPPHYVQLFGQIESERGDGSVVLPFPIWREAFINDADLALAKKSYELLNPHPAQTFKDKAALKSFPNVAAGKSFLNCMQDVSLPASLPWHPRLSEKLGLYRLVEMPGSHEACFTNPGLLAQKIIEAGRD